MLSLTWEYISNLKKKMKKNNRSRKLNRSRKGIDQRSVVAVFTEGRITEPQYVKVLKGIYRGVNVQVIDRYAGSPPEVLVKKALEYQRNIDKHNPKYDEIWCLFDRNEHLNIEIAIQNARKNNIKTAMTNPCFELWLVLHQENRSGHVSKESIQKRSQALGITEGKHLSETGKKLFYEKYDDAKNRAQRLEKQHIGNGSKSWENPSSQVWRFVDRLALLSEVGDG